MILKANSDQKTILIEQSYKEIQEICKKFQDDSGASNFDIKNLLREIANLWEPKEKNNFGFK